ncbi:MAG: nitroreductase family protein [Candidatus Marinimicrobia bacterium]|nr:nitroreductase family protein [Candidatus Neomarinimicrobiota bacterium]
MSIIDTIRFRSSQRSYIAKPLSADILKQIEAVLQKCPPGPFQIDSHFQLIHKSIAADQKIKLGTYGFISGAQHFIAGKTVTGPGAMVDYGYRMEWIILQLTALGLGSCWLGGSFSRSEYAELMNLNDNEVIPAVSPVGYPTQKRSLRDRLIRLGAGSDNRKPWSALFFEDDFEHPLTPVNADNNLTVLEMVRLAPSASNKQPWRIITMDGNYHFYLQRTPGYGRKYANIDLQKVDLGIAVCHFDLTTKEMGLTGHWDNLNSDILLPANTEYILSWIHQ